VIDIPPSLQRFYTLSKCGLYDSIVAGPITLQLGYMRLMSLDAVFESPHSASFSIGFCAQRKSLQHGSALIFVRLIRTDSHRQIRVHLATV
jgi:hypothetical protein